jgi:hypothetical protein
MNLIKGGLLCSGMYDLKPARLSARSSYVKFNDTMEDLLSSQRHLENLNTPLIVAYGTLETPEFQRQSQRLCKCCKMFKQTHRVNCWAKLQPLRVTRNSCQSLWSVRLRCIKTNATWIN